jgi:two-component system OmpR family sensor kinase
VGGFGIGYDIIYTIIKEYDININIESKINEGTKVTLSW